MPKVSVIIPAYNAERNLQECLLSLQEQTFKDFEVIVVDDGSLDKTGDIASKYARVVRADKNLGVGRARNLGAKEAKAEILAFTDADVVLPKGWLAKIIEDMRIHNVKCVGGGYSGSLGNSFMERFAYLELAYRRKNMPEFVNTVVSNNFACQREVFFACGAFPQNYKCEDLRLSFLISKKHAIFWDKDNGVRHHFKSSFKDYLKQQFYFGRDTVFSFYQYPGLFRKRTHQGRLLYSETFLMFVFLSFILLSRKAAIAIIFILILNYNFLLFLGQNGLSVPKCILVILARDIICVFSIFAGLGLCLTDIARNIFRKREDNR